MDKTMVSVPVEPTEAMLKAAHAAMLSDIPPDGESTYGPTISTHAIYRAYWAAMLSAAPAPQPVQGEAVQIAAPDHIADARKMVAAPGNVEPLPRATVKLVVSLLRHRRDSLSNDAAAWLERFAALRSQEPAYGPDGSMSIHYQQDGCQMYKHPPECWSQGQAVAVGDAMVERACRAYFPGWETFHPEAWKAPRRLGMRAAITAALAQQANKEQPPNA